MYSSIMKPAFESAAAVLDPFADSFRVEAELEAALRCRPARRDHVVGGLAPELVGVPGGWVRHGTVSSVVVGIHARASKSLGCASEKTIQVTSWAPHAPGYRPRADKFGIVIEGKCAKMRLRHRPMQLLGAIPAHCVSAAQQRIFEGIVDMRLIMGR